MANDTRPVAALEILFFGRLFLLPLTSAGVTRRDEVFTIIILLCEDPNREEQWYEYEWNRQNEQSQYYSSVFLTVNIRVFGGFLDTKHSKGSFA
jgi:hypothetical protein